MPLIAPVLGALITAQMPIEIKKVKPDAIPMPFQMELAMAVAEGFVKSLKSEAKAVGAVGLTAAGPGVGISGISPARMTEFAKQVFMAKIGSTGDATEAILMSIYTPTVLHLATATIISITGFGGPLLSVSGLVEANVANNIFNALPGPTQASMSQSQFGKVLVEAIAAGFAKEITQSGKPGPIPAAGIVPGPVIGMFT